MGNSSSTSGGHHHQGGGHGHHPHHPKDGRGGTRYPGYHPGYQANGGYDDGWSHSLETPEQRNRMKRGYFPPRAYTNGMPSPQKVLPTVHPGPSDKLLKATSNGAILHGGGTISGRKLTELELEIRKRRTVSCPANNDGVILSSGRSTPNLLMPRMGLSSSGNAIIAPTSSSSSRSRDFGGSEPDLRDVGRNNNKMQQHLPQQSDDPSGLSTDDRSSSPLPNSFTLISESPAKKQIRSRKKSKAPPPPPSTTQPHPQMQFLHPHGGPHPHPNDFLIPFQYQLQQNPQRQLLLAPVSSGSPNMMHHQQMQMQMQGHFVHEEKKRSRLFKTKAESRSAMNSPALRTTPTPTPLATPNLSNPNSNNELISRNSASSGSGNNKVVTSATSSNPSSHPIGHEMSKNSGSSGNKMKNQAPAPILNFPASKSKSPKPGQIIHQQSTTTTTSGGGGGNGSSGVSQTQQAVPKGGNNKNLQGMKMMKEEKKTFYFGMDNVVGTFKQKNKDQQQQQQQQQQAMIMMMNDKDKQVVGKTSSSSSPGQNQLSQAHVADLHKEISRRKMIQKLENEQSQASANGGQNSRSSSRNSAQQNHVQPQQINGHNNNKGGNKPINNSNNANRASESDSDGIHRRQDSGSFELNEKKVNGINVAKKMMPPQNKIRESSSDLSSSDLDVPLVVTRPTLPQKRPELPRFSPTAAWRAIDSPSRGSNNSGRSFDLEFSGGEGGGGGLHRFTRPSAPPRISAERSGDSGISAGSPANAIPLLEEEDEVMHDPRVDYDFDDEFSSSSPPLNKSSNNNSNNNNKSNKVKQGSSSNRGVTNAKHHHDAIAPPQSSNIKSGADRKLKCWTPEQDLDESSSDFDQDSDPILPPVPPKPGNHNGRKTTSLSSSVTSKHCNLFEGKRASAVVSDSDSKYFGGPSGNGGGNRFSSTDELNHSSRQGRYHGQNARNGGGNGPNKQKRFFNPRYRSPASAVSPGSHYRHQAGSGGGGFVGLDTNWFLSRSEPNSLNFVGIGMEESNFRFANKKKFAPPPPSSGKKSKNSQKMQAANVVQQKKQVIVGKSSKRTTNNNSSNNKKHFQSEDELECELVLDEEFDSSLSSSNDPTSTKATTTKSSTTTVNKKNNNLPLSGLGKQMKNKKHHNQTNVQQSSEIGYGPSSMNFNNSTSSSAYEDQEEELEMRDEEDEEEELMRDDLFDYLDAYEEGEFEREQELTTNLDGPFPSSGKQGNNAATTSTPENNVVIINHRNNNDQNQVTSNGNNDNSASSRPFSHHIMYLPSYDARKIFNQKAAQSWRRTRSVDALDGSHQEKLFKRESSPEVRQQQHQQQSGKERILHIEVEGRENRGFMARKSSVPTYLQPQKSPPCHVSNVTITSTPLRDESKFSQEEEERRAYNKKKFKFQSTLRVQERRKIEAELSREAEQAEEERLREIEEMSRVEEEFQKKRRAKAEAEARAKHEQGQYPNNQALVSPGIIGSKKFSSVSNQRKSPSPIREQHIDVNTRVLGNNNGGQNRGQPQHRDQQYRMMSQRQEPEGAPASVTVSSACNSSNSNGSTDLRKELITASKKRSGNLGNHSTNQTQELSEYRQEPVRQYCDYRRGNRQQSLSPARFIQKSSSSSDIFPIPSRRRAAGGGGSHSSKVSGSGRSSAATTTTHHTTTVHPQVVCDIPVRPHPYMVNASRLSGSNSTVHLVSEERPSSVVGSAQNLHYISGGGPSSPSVHSGDNYRRDWAHHLAGNINTRGGSGGGSGMGGVGGSGRASSVLSLHSAPPTTSPSDNFRNSASDLSRLNSNASPSFAPQHRTTSTNQQYHQQREHMIPNYRQYSASPVPSSTTATDSYHQMSEMSPSSRASPVRILSSKTNTTVISIGRGPQMMTPAKRPSKKKSVSSLSSTPSPVSPPASSPNSFQAQPYSNNNRTRGYRPVAFKPAQQQSQAAVN